MWKWKTVCQAAAPQELIRLTPSAPSRSLTLPGEPLRGNGDSGQIVRLDASRSRRGRAGSPERARESPERCP